MKKVYIASPYILGDIGKNMNRHLSAAARLAANGFCPVAPLLYHFVHIHEPLGDERRWTEISLCLLEGCHALLRLGGESKGADAEVARADKLDIPVYFTIGHLLREQS
jgi:hypothetical protein